VDLPYINVHGNDMSLRTTLVNVFICILTRIDLPRSTFPLKFILVMYRTSCRLDYTRIFGGQKSKCWKLLKPLEICSPSRGGSRFVLRYLRTLRWCMQMKTTNRVSRCHQPLVWCNPSRLPINSGGWLVYELDGPTGAVPGAWFEGNIHGPTQWTRSGGPP